MQTSGLPTRTSVPFAFGGAKNTIPVTASPTPGLASYTTGFPALTMTPIVAGGIPPAGQDFNGILNAITIAIQWENAGGRYAFDAAFSALVGGYPKGALIARAGYDGYWQNTVENNTTNPDAGGAGWTSISGKGSDYAIDTGAANIYGAAYSPVVISVTDGFVYRFKASNANTGPSTFTPNPGVIAASPIVGSAHAALQGGEIVATGDVWVQWNSSIGSGSWVLIDSTGGALQVSPATKSQHAMQISQATGRVIGTQIFTASGTYTPTPGMTSCIIEAQGGGGAGAGVTNPSAGNVSLGSSGCAGGYAKGRVLAASIGASQVVTIGAGAISPVGAAGPTGGTTSVGSLVTAPGGPGGAALNNTAPPIYNGNGGISSVATGGNIFTRFGVAGFATSAVSASAGIAGIGGASAFGDGGGTAALNSTAQSALNYGSGGGGVITNNAAGISVKAGNGATGVVIITEFS